MLQVSITFDQFGTVTSPTDKFADLGDLASGLLEIAIFIAGFLLALWLTWGVFKYLTAEGNKEELVKARNHMRWALVGFIVVLLAYSASRYVQNIIPTQSVGTSSTGGLPAILNLFGGKGPGNTAPIPELCPQHPEVGASQCDVLEVVPLSQYPSKIVADGGLRPLYTIPYLYHQQDVNLNWDTNNPLDRRIAESGACIEDPANKDSVGLSACGPSSLAMISEAFNGHDPNVQTANNLARLLLASRTPNGETVMNCSEGTRPERLSQFAASSSCSTVTGIFPNPPSNAYKYYCEDASWTTFHEWNDLKVDIGKVYDSREGDYPTGQGNPSFSALENYYNRTRMPVLVGDLYAGRSGHYVVVVGISENYVWVIDPYDRAQGILKFDKNTFANKYFLNFVEVSPIPSNQCSSISPETASQIVCTNPLFN